MVYDGETTLFQNCKSCGAPIVVPAEVVEANRQPIGEPVQNLQKAELVIDAIEPEILDSVEQTPLDDPKLVANARIFEATNAGNNIVAIKMHREAFNSDLQTAKEAIETLARNIAESKRPKANEVPENVSTNDAGLTLKKIFTELSAGRKIEAIKLFRESFNTGLKEAKDAVEAMERGEDIKVSDYT